MPWGDRTGPLGLGPRTGRGLGYCSGFNEPGYVKPGGWGWGRGFGWGRGRGRGWRCWGWGRGLGWGWRRFWSWFGTSPQITPEEESQILKEEAEFLKRRLEAVEKRLSEIEK
jgi:hypothetical protein